MTWLKNFKNLSRKDSPFGRFSDKLEILYILTNIITFIGNANLVEVKIE